MTQNATDKGNRKAVNGSTCQTTEPWSKYQIGAWIAGILGLLYQWTVHVEFISVDLVPRVLATGVPLLTIYLLWRRDPKSSQFHTPLDWGINEYRFDFSDHSTTELEEMLESVKTKTRYDTIDIQSDLVVGASMLVLLTLVIAGDTLVTYYTGGAVNIDDRGAVLLIFYILFGIAGFSYTAGCYLSSRKIQMIECEINRRKDGDTNHD
jgi:hypothetical protein